MPVLEFPDQFPDQRGGQPDPPAAEPAVDVAVLDALIAEIGEGTPELRSLLLGDFLADAPEQMSVLVSAAAGGDAAGVSSRAHQMRSGCAVLGAVRLAALLADLEQRAGVAPGSELPALTAPAAAEFRRAQAELIVLQGSGASGVGGDRNR